MIGRDLRVIREACGVTMGDLAEATGMRVSFISDAERGVRDIDAVEVDLYVSTLARIVREHTPPVTIDAGGGAGNPQPTLGISMLRILAQGDRDTMTLADQMRYPCYRVSTLARRYERRGHVRVCGTVPSKNAGPPVNVYAITDEGRAFLAARSTP